MKTASHPPITSGPLRGARDLLRCVATRRLGARADARYQTALLPGIGNSAKLARVARLER